MAQKNLVQVYVSVTTLDHDIARAWSRAQRRRAGGSRRSARWLAPGVPIGVMMAPIVPFLTDAGIESVLEAAAEAGAIRAGYTLMRLPWELKDLFKDWLEHNYPLKAAHVMSRVRQMRNGKENDPNFGTRQRGTGLIAELLEKALRQRLPAAGPERERRRRRRGCHSASARRARAGRARLASNDSDGCSPPSGGKMGVIPLSVRRPREKALSRRQPA